MATDSIGRREFLQSLGAGALAATLSATPGTATQRVSSDSDTPTFGIPIEKAFNHTTGKETTSLGSINNDSVFVSYQSWNQGGNTSSSTVAKLNRFTGKADWSKTIGNYVYGPIETAGRLYFGGHDSVFCWDAATGDELWRHSLEEDITNIGHVGELVFVHGYNYQKTTRNGESVNEITHSTLYAFDTETGEINWRNSSDYAYWSSSATENYVILRKSQSYITDSELISEKGQLVAFNKSNGNLVWESDPINPQHFNEQNGVLVTQTIDSDIYLFKTSGEQILHHAEKTSTYYITDDLLLIARSDGGIRIFDHSGIEQTEEPLYSEDDITSIRSGHAADPFLLVTDNDKLIAISGTTYEEQWRTTQPANSLSVQYEIGFATHGTTQITAINVETGKVVWHDNITGVKSLRTRLYNGFLYVSGESAPLRAYSGRRGRALASLNRMERQNSLSGAISSYIPGSNYLSQADQALENGKYDKAHRLLNREAHRRLTIDGILGVSGLATAYGTGRIGVSKWRQQRLTTAIDRVNSTYPIDVGELAGLEPTDIIAQGRTARDSLKSKTAVPLRQSLSDDYGDLLQTLTKLADRHPKLVDISKYLETIDQSLLPESWTGDLRTAVEEGNIQRVDTLLETIQTAEALLDRLQSFSETVSESSFSESTDQFRQLVVQEISGQGRAIDGIEIGRTLNALETSINTIDSYQDRFSVFDLAEKRTAIQNALQSPTNLTASAVQELRKYPDLFGIAEQVEMELSQVDFGTIGASRTKFESRAQAMFAQSNIEELHSLTETLQEMRLGRWSYSDLFSVSPTEFEHLIAALFADMGYQVAVTDQQGDKGIDVIARNATEVLAIQVKQHSRGNKVGRPTVQQVIGAMAQAGADQAVIVSSAGFTKTAIEASRELGNAVNLINGQELVQLLTESQHHPDSSASEYRSRARSNSSSGSHSRSNQRTSYPAGGQESLNKETAYEILDLDPPVSQSKIKSQYRKKVKDTHPDTGGSTEEFKRVKEAYSVLSDD